MEIRKIALRVSCGLSLVFSPVLSQAGFTAGVEGGSSGAKVEDPGQQINQGSNKAASKNNTGQILSYALSAAELAYAAYNVPPCSSGEGSACARVAIFTIMGIMSAKQGAEHGSVAGAARFTAGATDGVGDGSGSQTEQGSLNNGNGVSKFITASNDATKKLQKDGILSADKKTITTPDGKSYKVADMTSAAAMQAAGIPKASIDSAMEALAKMEKKAMEKLKIGSQTAANGYEEGGGGGGGSSGVSGEGDPGMTVAGAGVGAGVDKNALARDPSSLAGMSKNYNGEPIGVAADSIFLMMNRRYKVKESQDSFFGINDILLKK